MFKPANRIHVEALRSTPTVFKFGDTRLEVGEIEEIFQSRRRHIMRHSLQQFPGWPQEIPNRKDGQAEQ